jgi:hypothetical protein
MIYTLTFDDESGRFAINHKKAIGETNVSNGIARSNDFRELQTFVMFISIIFKSKPALLNVDMLREQWQTYKTNLIFFPKNI